MHRYLTYNTRMHKTKFKARSFSKTLELLCHAKGGEFLRAGQINRSHVARVAGTSQSNVSRWLSEEFSPHDENVKKLARVFGILPSQMRGEDPINKIDGLNLPTSEDEEFYHNYQRLPEKVKNLIREQVKLYQTKDD